MSEQIMHNTLDELEHGTVITATFALTPSEQDPGDMPQIVTIEGRAHIQKPWVGIKLPNDSFLVIRREGGQFVPNLIGVRVR